MTFFYWNSIAPVSFADVLFFVHLHLSIPLLFLHCLFACFYQVAMLLLPVYSSCELFCLRILRLCQTILKGLNKCGNFCNTLTLTEAYSLYSSLAFSRVH